MCAGLAVLDILPDVAGGRFDIQFFRFAASAEHTSDLLGISVALTLAFISLIIFPVGSYDIIDDRLSLSFMAAQIFDISADVIGPIIEFVIGRSVGDEGHGSKGHGNNNHKNSRPA